MTFGKIDIERRQIGCWKNWQRYYIKLTKLVSLKENLKKGIFMAFLRNEGFFVFYMGKL